LIGPGLLALATHDTVRRAVTALPLSNRVAHRFVAGETTEQAVAAVAGLARHGLLSTVDHLGEDTSDAVGARSATTAYLELLDSLATADLLGAAEVSVKLTAIGLDLPDGREVALKGAQRIAARAAALGTTMTVDMEDHTKTDATLAIVRQLRVGQPDVGLALQAYLHRTPADVAEFSAAGARVRLCKGAYREPPTVALTDRAAISAAYARAVRVLMSGPGYPMLATHDPQLIAFAEDVATGTRRPDQSFEFQLLNGVRPDEQSRLADANYRVRVYLPYGEQWYGYMMRRMAEKPANLALFLRALKSRR